MIKTKRPPRLKHLTHSSEKDDDRNKSKVLTQKTPKFLFFEQTKVENKKFCSESFSAKGF